MMSTLGNHEFNYGLPYLQNTLNHLHHPILCANIFDYNNAPLTGQGVSYFKRGDDKTQRQHLIFYERLVKYILMFQLHC
jgi:2',3'-cyclic-nucleotide 2'-phosphodiesterase (5'-nucleotidase family)